MPSGKPGTRKPEIPMEDRNPVGRPTKYSPEVLEYTAMYFEEFEAWYESPVTITRKDRSVEERMERIANPPPSVLDLHRFLKLKGLDVSRWSLYDWSDEGKPTEIPEFSQVIKRGMEKLYPDVLQENAMMGKYPGAFPIFAAKNRMKWTDRQEIDNKGTIEQKHSGSVSITLDMTKVSDLLNGPTSV